MLLAADERGQWQSALDILKQMEAAAGQGTDDAGRSAPAPNEYVYGAAIGACAVSARWEEALRLLRRMELDGLSPNVFCCNGALSACDRAGQPEAALALLESMRGRLRERAAPSVVSYCTTLSALGRKPGLTASEKAVGVYI